MSLPAQVRRQAERAQELLDQANGKPGDPPAPAAAEPAPAEPQDPTPVTPAPEPTPAAPAVEPTPAPVPPVAQDWEQKYRTLQGVLSAEQRKWNAEKANLESRIATIEAAKPAAPAAPAPTPAPAAAPISQADLDTYGPELLDVIRRQATEMATQIVAQQMEVLKPQLEKTHEQVTSVASRVYRSDEEKFYGELASAVPDWETVNTDAGWLQWLGEVDALSGVTRQVYLDNASQNLDHARVARLFNAFKEQAGLNKPAAPAAAPAPALSPTPRTVGTSSAPSHREPQTGVKRSEIAAHYSRAARDRSYRESDEHKQFEQRLQQAAASNKIIEA